MFPLLCCASVDNFCFDQCHRPYTESVGRPPTISLISSGSTLAAKSPKVPNRQLRRFASSAAMSTFYVNRFLSSTSIVSCRTKCAQPPSRCILSHTLKFETPINSEPKSPVAEVCAAALRVCLNRLSQTFVIDLFFVIFISPLVV